VASRELFWPLLLLAVSMATTCGTGARFMENFRRGLPPVVSDGDLWPWSWLLHHLGRAWLGWSFSLSLLGILLTHEMGHYVTCRRHEIGSSLPWVLPAPTLSGTAGAVIRIHDRIPSRAALLDVGAWGPIWGFLVSIPVLAVGFLLSKTAPAGARQAMVHFHWPLAVRALHRLLGLFLNVPAADGFVPHPVWVAGWIGLFVTSLNLIPGGQLDGGHILYSLWPRAHRAVTRVTTAALLLAGIGCWPGWLLWAFFLVLPAMRHPRVAHPRPLGRRRVAAALLTLAILVVSISPDPFEHGSFLGMFLRHRW
jgi:Zn-dependent protease